MDTYTNVDQAVSLLRIETSKSQSELKIPSFLKVLKEVTTDDHYASSTLAKNGWKMKAEDKQGIMKAVQ